jgi:putative Holliday junction resolvase
VTVRYLGLDPGERRVGVALSDATGTIATPVRYIDTRRDDVPSVVSEICAENEVTAIVVGLPVSLDGSEGPAVAMARSLGASVADATELPVHYHDERFTSHTAETALIEGGVSRKARKEKRDQIAAAVMLQSYLDRRSNDANR